MKGGLVVCVFFGFVLLLSLNFVSAITPASVSLGKQEVIVVYAYPSYVSSHAFFDKQIAADLFFGEDSLASYVNQMSFGQTEIVGSDGNPGGVDDIYGPFALEMQSGECTSENVYKKLAEVLKPYHVAKEGLTVAVLLVLENCEGFTGGGETGTLDFGTAQEPLKISSATDFTSSSFAKFEKPTIAHELSHSLGLGHAMYSYCLFQEGVSPDDCQSTLEHGDPYDLMGTSQILGQSNSVILDSVGWLSESGEHKIITVDKNNLPVDRTFILKPLSDPNPGLKAIKIPHGRVYTNIGTANTFLYAEWRQPIGLDKKLQDYFIGAEKETNVFNGVLLHTNVFQERYSKLFHPIALDAQYNGECITGRNCPRTLQTALPYGKSSTNPNTDTIIKVGNPTAEGLPITIEHLGRTDFTPPEIGEIKVTDTDNPCLKTLDVNPIDKNGISKVEWYELDRSNKKNSKLLTVQITPPYNYIGDLTKTNFYNGVIFARVYDNAKQEGGKAEDNYGDSSSLSLNLIINKCNSKPPRVIIESPYLDVPFDTKNEVPFTLDPLSYNLKINSPIRNPIPLTIKMISEEGFPISDYNLLYNDVFEHDGREIFFKAEGGLQGSGLTERTVSLSPFLELGKHTLSLRARAQDQGSIATEVLIEVTTLPPIPFIRGDSNNDGKVDISDAINTLNYLYSGRSDIECQNAGDANDDGRLDISDAIYTLNYLFQGKPLELPDPNNLDEVDKTYDTLDCGHSVCKENMCSFVYGEGKDECMNNYDCGEICKEDSDANEEYRDGNNPFVKGQLNERSDTCYSQIYLKELICNSNSDYRYNKEYDCSELGENYGCQDGACILMKHSICEDNACVEVEGEGEDQCIFNKDCNCNEEDATPEYQNGKNPFIRGESEDCLSVGSYKLIEGFCYGGGKKLRLMDCGTLGNYICKDGACVPAS